MEIKFDTSKLSAQLGRLVDVSGIEAPKIVANEARKFLKQVADYTPPKDKKQGEEAVKADLSKLYFGLDDDLVAEVMERKAQRRYNADSQMAARDTGYERLWFDTKSQSPVEVKTEMFKPNASKRELQDFHNRNRRSRGRTKSIGPFRSKQSNRWELNRMVVGKRNLAAFVKDQLARVGRARAGWIPSMRALGLTIKPYVARHASGARGDVASNIFDKTKPSITVINSAQDITQIRNQVYQALKTRQKAIASLVRRMINGNMKYAFKLK